MNTDHPALQEWLQKVCPLPLIRLQPMTGDASFRRYYRVSHQQQSYVVMDASLEKNGTRPFVAIAQALLARGIAVPEIIAADFEQGFLLISDLGQHLYLNELNVDNADALYKTALDSLAQIQACPDVAGWSLPNFDQSFMQRELNEFNRWVINDYLALNPSLSEQEMLADSFIKLITKGSQQPQVFMHRDYHSANLMILPQQGVGVLDFQDACRGPLTYDVVSLLRDCYIDWPQEQVMAWLAYYHRQLGEFPVFKDLDFAELTTWFDWMGVQRHLKASFIFARKYLRDHTLNYLKYLPRTFNYAATITGNYPELQALHEYLNEKVLPLLEKRGAECVV